MKKNHHQIGLRVLVVLVLIMNIQACSKKSSSDAVCGQASMFSTASDCQLNSGGSTCVMTTAQGDSGSVVCWMAGQNQTTTTTTTTGTALCSPAYIETISPSSCSSTQTVQTITRTCKAGCTCSFGATQTLTQNCTADIYGGNHYSADCTGGVEMMNSQKLCSFTAASCPAGFTPYTSGSVAYTITEKVGGYNLISCDYTPNVKTWTGEHASFQAIAPETVKICSELNCGWFSDTCKTYQTLTATVKKVLCY